MSLRLRLAAGLTAVVALVAGALAALLGGIGASSTADMPQAHPTPTDVTDDLSVPAGVEVSTGRLTQDGVERSYLVLAPAAATPVAPTTPLVVSLHGRNATAGQEAGRNELLPYVAAGAAVLVYPVGFDQGWNNDDGCCGTAVAAGLSDVDFVGQVTDTVRARFGLTGPTDLVGYSNGGRLAFDIACRDADRYDAIAAVGAVPTTPTCPDESVPVPVFTAVTLDDEELPTAENPSSAAAALNVMSSTWVSRNSCVGSPTVSVGGQATVTTWTACEAGTVVETVTWPQGGHIWPHADDVGSPDAADLVWSFLSGVHARR